MARKIKNDLFEDICSKENLMLAWRRVENSLKHGNIWYDELEIAAYKFNLVNNLTILSNKMSNGSYQMHKILPAPFPKASKIIANTGIDNEDNSKPNKSLQIRQSFAIHIEDQLVWMAVCGVLGPYFEEEMPAWSYGNRLFLNTWKNEKNHWINGVYRTTSINFYRKWTQGWPLYRHVLSTCIKRMAFRKDKMEEGDVYIGDDFLTIEENNAQENEAFRLNYLEDGYFSGENKQKLYYRALDLTKFYPHVKMSKIKELIKNKFDNQCSDEFYVLIDTLTNFEVEYESSLSEDVFTDAELAEMELYKDIVFDGLPTGLIVAGALANIYMLKLDKEVSERLKQDKDHHVLHFRYVDDHLMLSDDKSKLDEWYKWYIQKLKEFELEVNEEKTESNVIDPRYPTPLLTQTLHKISEISRLSLDLLSSNEFDMVHRDLQMLLVTDFPNQEIKKGTRTSFACTMLSRLASDVNVDYDKIHQRREEWLTFVNSKFDSEDRNLLNSLIFTSEGNYPENLDEKIEKKIGKEGKDLYESVRNAIADSKRKIIDIEKGIFNLLVYAIKETPDKPNMWLKLLDFCVFHIPNKIETVYKILNRLKSKEAEELHPLGFEYIWASLNNHLALRIVRATYRLASNMYKNPMMKEKDELFLNCINDSLGIFKKEFSPHYLVEDSMFILNKAKQLLAFSFMDNKEFEANRTAYLKPASYHGLQLDASFWLLWAIERLNYGNPQHDLQIPEFIIRSLSLANQDSPFFLQLLYTCIGKVQFDAFDKNKIKVLKLIKEQKNTICRSVYGERVDKEILKFLNIKSKSSAKSNSSFITLLDWIKEVRYLEMDNDKNDLLQQAICSEYAATLIMKYIVKFFLDKIETLDSFSINPVAIFLKKTECWEDKDWDHWISIKEIHIKCLKTIDDTLYRYPLKLSKKYRKEWGVIYGLGVIFLQMLTKEYRMPWVFNRPEYGFEWDSILKRLMANGKISSRNCKIVTSCLSLEDKETLKLKSILDGKTVFESPLISNEKIDKLETLLSQLDKSLDELRENQISVANREIRQLVMIKLKNQ